MNISFRNTTLYLLIILAYITVIYLSLKSKIFVYLISLLLIAESFRFGWKYLPFVEKKFVFSETPIIQFLKNDPEKHFRIMAERGPLLPANSWSLYHLSSPLGYDPMAIKKYFLHFNQNVNDRPTDSGVSRYLEPEKYPAKILGDYNVKYLLAIKYDKNGHTSAEGNINTKINQNDWEKVFDDRSVAVLKNKFYKPRAEIINSSGKPLDAIINISQYTSNSINIDYSIPNSERGELLLRNTWYPGWQVYNNGHLTKTKEQSVFSTVEISGTGKLEYRFFPSSLKIGIIIFITSVFLNGVQVVVKRKYKYA